MNIFQDVTLSDYSTMRLGGVAAQATEVHDRQELADALAWAQERDVPTIMVGSGSNIVWKDEGFPGLLIVNKIAKFEIKPAEGLNHLVTIGAGENWDSVVERTVAAGLTGIEALSAIPGTAGATPVQNVGAYGQEIADTLVSVEAYDAQTHSFVTMPNQDCAFGYRTSRFKTTDKGRFYIVGLTLHLTKGNPAPPFYASLQKYLDEHGVTEFTPASIRAAVIAIRSTKLPDPSVVANNGSFFANPIVENDVAEKLLARYPELPHWPASGGRQKLAAAWLVEQAGFKDAHDQPTGMATWHAQALVLVNEHAKTTADLLAFKQKITDAVQAKFAIHLEQEPELLP